MGSFRARHVDFETGSIYTVVMTVPEIQEELLRQEYPFLMPGHDPDIEQYFHLRSVGRSGEALNLYQSRLRRKYPNDEFRTTLMRCYRNRDPAYRILLLRAYKVLAERSLERVKRVIVYIADKAESYNTRDVYSTLKAVEGIMMVLPKDHYEAIAVVERYSRYAGTLGIRARHTQQAANLIRSYLTDSIEVVNMERRRREEIYLKEREDKRRQLIKADWEGYQAQKKQNTGSGPMIDFSTVTFSKADLARIEIPKNFTRIEDQTLAYCVKYWNFINDAVLERALFLYSRKYGVKNYDAYLVIRQGRQSQKRDEEILASVMAVLVTGYYYSIRGDKYLQQQWNYVKNAIRQPQPAGKVPRKTGRKEKIHVPQTVKPQSVNPQAAVSHILTDAAETKPVKPKTVKQKDPANAAEVKEAKPKEPPPHTAKPEVSEEEYKKEIPRTVNSPAVPADKSAGSVSDRLKELSGRSYDVFHERFMAKAMPSIRKILGAGRGMFFTPPIEAENLVFNFLQDHYSDPYMNWKESKERTALQKMGFTLESLEPVIAECFKQL
jgi:hypothetical protein